MRLHFIFLLLVISSTESLAQNIYLRGTAGAGHLEVEPEYQISGNSNSNSTINLAGSIIYRTDNVSLELSASTNALLDFLKFGDNDNLSELLAFIGYRFNVNERLRITPKLGFSRWKLVSEEGRFLNPGPEDSMTYRGNSEVIALDFGVKALIVSIRTGNYDFGKHSALNVGFEFKLR